MSKQDSTVCPGCGLEFNSSSEGPKVTVEQALDQLARDLGRDYGLSGIHYEFGTEEGLNTAYTLELDDVVEEQGTIVFRMAILEPGENDEGQKTYDAGQSMETLEEYILGDIRASFRYLRDIPLKLEMQYVQGVGQ